MKKKLVAFITIAILAGTILTGCSLLTVNAERDYNQVIATVEYGGMTAKVTKGDLLEYYSQYSQMYLQYYGWSQDKAMNEFSKTLAKKELLILKAREYYATKTGKAMDGDIFNFLGYDEQKYVIEQTNEQFQESYDELVKEIKKENEANLGKDDDDDDKDEEDKKDELAPRPSRPEKEEDTEFEADDTVTKDDLPEHFPADKDPKKDEAWKRFEKRLKDQFKDFNYFLEQQKEARLLAKYQDDVNDDPILDVTDEQLVKEYNFQYKTTSGLYTDHESYKGAVDKNTVSYVNYSKDYVRVKSILLQFSEAQKAAFDNVKAVYPDKRNEDIVKSLREALALNTGEKLDNTFVDCGIKVNVSNPDYDPDALCEETECPCVDCSNHDKTEGESSDCEPSDDSACPCVECENNAYDRRNVDYSVILQEIAAGIAKAEVDKRKELEGSAYTDVHKEILVAEARIDAFEDWIWLVNDDPGMHEADALYTITPEGEKSDYVDEFTDLGRALAKEGLSGVNVSDPDAIGAKSVAMTDEMAAELGVNGADYKLSFVVNDFGIHIIMIATVPVDAMLNTLQENVSDEDMESGNFVLATKEIDGHTFYVMGLDYVLGIDDDGELVTVRSTLIDKLEKRADSQNYSDVEYDFFKENEEKSIVVDYDFIDKIKRDVFGKDYTKEEQ